MLDSNQQNYKRKSYRRAFQQVDWPNLDYWGQLMFRFVYIGMKFQWHFAMYSSLFSDTQFINKRWCEKKNDFDISQKLEPIWKN